MTQYMVWVLYDPKDKKDFWGRCVDSKFGLNDPLHYGPWSPIHAFDLLNRLQARGTRISYEIREADADDLKWQQARIYK